MSKLIGLIVVAMGVVGCGDTGAKGAVGSPGEPGLPGEVGPKGDAGPRGDAGPMGDVGPQGDQGPEGATGPRGDAGPMGDQGARGIQGVQGIQGIQGAQGVPGPKGDQGDKGTVQVKDGSGAVLGTLVSLQQGLFLVRTSQDVLVSYNVGNGALRNSAASLGDTLFYTSSNCTGTPLASATIERMGLINDGALYAASLPYLTNVTRHSEKDFTTGACSAVNGTDNFMTATLVGPVPATATLPFKIE